MKTSPTGYMLVRTEEALTLTVKSDTGGKQEIGYGHDLLPGESYPNGITEDFAENLLCEDITKCEAVLNAIVPASCSQNQFDALIDFTYECGITALRQLLAHGWFQVPQQLPKWVHAHVNGQIVELAGMVSRREKELQLWNSGTSTTRWSA